SGSGVTAGECSARGHPGAQHHCLRVRALPDFVTGWAVAATLAPPDRRIASRLRCRVLSPMPFTWRRSSTDLNAPCESRQATIACALLNPIPSSELAIVAASAWLMSTGVAAKAGNAQASVNASAARMLRIMSSLLGYGVAPWFRRVQIIRTVAAWRCQPTPRRASAPAAARCRKWPTCGLIHFEVRVSAEEVDGRQQTPGFRRRDLGRRGRAADHRLHPHPQQVAAVRSAMGGARLHG